MLEKRNERNILCKDGERERERERVPIEEEKG